jgi:hypothetical protein
MDILEALPKAISISCWEVGTPGMLLNGLKLIIESNY